MKLASAYNPGEVEKKIYTAWIEKDLFKVEIKPDRKPFTIIIPPPNVTGSLHMGHALDNTIQDIIIRFRRMQGYNALWIPGTDHAGIATQNVVEKQLAKEGLSRKTLGRKKFLERVWAWKEEYGRNIVYQLQRLGVSCDWSRERFTMDEVCSRAVRTAFKSLFDRGLIYRGMYMINWCPRCFTALSDLEVLHVETEGNLYYIKYPFEGESEGVVVATTRPETMLGDTALAVNPCDVKYKDHIGKKVILPILGRKMPVIADDYVDPSFGTGALKITPAHDPNDFEVGNRHNLERVVVIDEKGNMTGEAGPYKGMSREDCRKKILEDLKEGGFLIKIEPHIHNVGACYRCDTIIEPLISEQWFCKMKELAQPAIEAVRKRNTRFFPEKYADTYLYWMENIKDWCISRQLWWGHRIPVWYCSDCNCMFASLEDPAECEKCSSENISQDNDVLDTWFSSGLWPLSTMGWPEDTQDLRYFYPTSVLVTARDIIFLWVARMMMMGLEFKGNVPFRHVFIHSTILNREGRRMSKSLGTGVDPLELIDKYGADATRFGLTFMTAQGQDVKFTEERLEMSRNFANKIWNATRFVLINLEDFSPENYDLDSLKPALPDRWILSRYFQVILKSTNAYANYEFSTVARELYEFVWNEFCDWYLEYSKLFLYSGKEERKDCVRYILWYVLAGVTRLLHPLMPFITEEIWNKIPSCAGSVMFAEWPGTKEEMIDEEVEKNMEFLMDTIKTIRTLRGEIAVPPSREVSIHIEAPEEKLHFLNEYRGCISELAKAKPLDITKPLEKKPLKTLSMCFQDIEIYMPFSDLIDVGQEIEKLKKEVSKAEKNLEKINKKLSNRDFLEKAPEEVVEKEKERKEELSFKLERQRKRLEVFEKG